MDIGDLYYVDRIYSSWQQVFVRSDRWSGAHDIAGPQLANVHNYWHNRWKAKQKKRPSAGKAACQIGYRSKWDWLCVILWLFIDDSLGLLYIVFRGLHWVNPLRRQRFVLTGMHGGHPRVTSTVMYSKTKKMIFTQIVDIKGCMSLGK